MLHLIKLSVGPRDLAQLRALQTRRAVTDPPLRHLTRMMPKRAAELLDGGSIYWVVGGLLCARQRLLAIESQPGADGTPHCALLLDPALVAVETRRVKPFQGWRYLPVEDAPADITGVAPATGAEAMPEAMRRELQLLCLL